MDYEAVLAQVLALLQQEQRLSYRVLKRQLHLEDDLLEDLKEDLYLCQTARRGRGRARPRLGRRGGAASRSSTTHRPARTPACHAG